MSELRTKIDFTNEYYKALVFLGVGGIIGGIAALEFNPLDTVDCGYGPYSSRWEAPIGESREIRANGINYIISPKGELLIDRDSKGIVDTTSIPDGIVAEYYWGGVFTATVENGQDGVKVMTIDSACNK